ncbi:hypothetical protein BZA77DRAFT_298955 [Pyronema omphalodes]|nr:hypothetical protein BZA77DRAFT_298955 [Pyronema omphalodes]
MNFLFSLFLLSLATISPVTARAVNATCWDRDNNATVLFGIGGISGINSGSNTASQAVQNLIQPLTFTGSLVKPDSSCFTLRDAPQLHQLPTSFTNNEYQCFYFADPIRPWSEDYKPWIGSVEVTGPRGSCCTFYEGENCQGPPKRSVIGGAGPVEALSGTLFVGSWKCGQC